MHPNSRLVAPALVAVPLFAVTNADDLVLLTLFFANRHNRASAIIAGQLVGIGALTLISIVLARLALQLPETWIPLLGLVPIAIGIKQFFSSDDDEAAPPSSLSWTAVALITMANGGDNIGVYVPVFATESAPAVIVISAMFMILTLVWCGLARQVVRLPRLGQLVQRYASAISPYVLIAVGAWVVAKHPWIQAWLAAN